MDKTIKFNFKFFLTFFIIALWVVRSFFIDVVRVSGSSMLPTYQDGDFVIVKKFDKAIDRGDIVVINVENRLFGKKIIKRIVGLPGDSVLIQDGVLYVNDQKMDYEEIEDPGLAVHEIILQGEEYFVVGDNVNNSSDSRSIGAIAADLIIGIVYR